VLLGIRAMLAAYSGVTIVGEALSTRALIELLRRTRCDVLVTDLCMPDASGAAEDGLGLIRHLRREWPLLRVVVITASTNPSILRALIADDALSALGKADSVDALWQAINAGANGARYVGRSVAEALSRPRNAECPLPPPRLSRRQTEVVKRFVDGQSMPEIAAALGCHQRTVSQQKREAMAMLGVANNAGLFSHWYAFGIPEN
jgi:two-component system capsular synthesis response regulator RcsB